MNAHYLGRVEKRHIVNSRSEVGDLWTLGDGVACVELEGIAEHELSVVHLGVSVEKTLVEVIGDPPSVLHLAHHVMHCEPRHALQNDAKYIM